MSQSAGMAGGGRSASSPKASATGRAVLLLAFAVVLGAGLLNQLDDTEVGTRTISAAAPPVEEDTAAPVNDNSQVTVVSAPALRTPAEVKVLVANGVGVTGAASKVAGRLQPAGYQLLKPGNTLSRNENSTVQFAPGYEAEAQALATSLGMPGTAVQPLTQPAPVAELEGANVVVIVGNELANAAQTQAATPLPDSATGTSTTAASNSNPAVNGPLSQMPGSTEGNTSNNVSSATPTAVR